MAGDSDKRTSVFFTVGIAYTNGDAAHVKGRGGPKMTLILRKLAIMTTLSFGRSGCWPAEWLRAPAWRRIAPAGPTPLDDPAAAMAAALEDPLEFPPLKRAVISGDRIAVAVAPGVPQARELIAGLLAVLAEANVPPEDVTICHAQDRPPLTGPAGGLLERARQVVHRPEDPSGLAYLAASAAARPIYFPRVVCDADVVIPLGWRLPAPAHRPDAQVDALFPTFSDAATQRRIRERDAGMREGTSVPSDDPAALDEAEEAAWLLGVQFAVEIVPGPRGSVLQVVAGDREAVRRESSRLCRSVWTQTVDRPVSAVVATVAHADRQATWGDVVEVIARLEPLVEAEGAVVICTDLVETPEESDVARLSPYLGTPDDPRATDAARRVYLVSELPDAVVESLGLIPVAASDELARLVGQLGGGLVVEHADQMVLEPTPASSIG